jgi:hypothetical protein
VSFSAGYLSGHESNGDVADPNVCCCSHGQRCNCALKKEHLDPVPELESTDDDSILHQDCSKPRLAQLHSESSLTVFANGHHKPTHKHHNLSHTFAPYVIPKGHLIHGVQDAARSVDSLPATNMTTKGIVKSEIHDSITSAQQEERLIKSEHNSPIQRPSEFDQFSAQVTPLDLNYGSLGRPYLSRLPSDLSAVSTTFSDYNYASSDVDQPILSAGLGMNDWGDCTFDSAFDPSSLGQCYSSYDSSALGQQALSNYSSGEASEIEDYGSFPSPIDPPSLIHNPFGSEPSEICETDTYRLSTASSVLQSQQATTQTSNNNFDSLNIDDYIESTPNYPTVITPTSSAENYEVASVLPYDTSFEEMGKLPINMNYVLPTNDNGLDTTLPYQDETDDFDFLIAAQINDSTGSSYSETGQPKVGQAQ